MIGIWTDGEEGKSIFQEEGGSQEGEFSPDGERLEYNVKEFEFCSVKHWRPSKCKLSWSFIHHMSLP